MFRPRLGPNPNVFSFHQPLRRGGNQQLKLDVTNVILLVERP